MSGLESHRFVETCHVWGVDSVKSTVSVLEEGDFSEEGGWFRLEGVLFSWRIPLFVEEGCVLISRRGSSSSGVARGHTSPEEGCVLISRRGSSSSGVGVILRRRRGAF